MECKMAITASYSEYLCAKIGFMKNVSLVLNGVLLVAVAVLYYLHFKGKGEVTAESPIMQMPVNAGTIVYVNSDSLLEEYDYYKAKKNEFEVAQEKIKQELKAQNDKLQREVEIYQKQAIGMTDKERAEKENDLGMKQQQLMQRKEELLNRLDEQQSSSSEELYAKLNAYLKKNNQGRNYSFVLGYQRGGGILFANDSLNITKEVIQGLNKEYAEQEGK